jgi:hypothetical protein
MHMQVCMRIAEQGSEGGRRARSRLPPGRGAVRTGLGCGLCDGGAQAEGLSAGLALVGGLVHVDLSFNRLLSPAGALALGPGIARLGPGLRVLNLSFNTGFQGAGPALARHAAPAPAHRPAHTRSHRRVRASLV